MNFFELITIGMNKNPAKLEVKFSMPYYLPVITVFENNAFY